MNAPNSLVGDRVEIVSVNGTTLRVKHGDTEWSAKSEIKFKKGDFATITDVDGIILKLGK